MDFSLIKPDWKAFFEKETQKPYFNQLEDFVEQEYKTTLCFPPKENIFAAFEYCSFEEVKIVILGQDPYPGLNHADGLCFSVNEEIPFPHSLQNIFKEIQADIGTEFPEHGNLKTWAQEGVLLLNSILSVRAGEAGSHQRKGWEKFTDAIIEKIANDKEHVVFMLWGGYAKKKGKKIDTEKHLVLESGHPSPLSANRGFWFGNKHFSKANEYLIELGKEPIHW